MVNTRASPDVAVVTSVVEGKHGPYAVSKTECLSGSITFSLDSTVWQEERWPERGEHVILSEITFKSGWRAGKARFLRPDDEFQEAAKQ